MCYTCMGPNIIEGNYLNGELHCNELLTRCLVHAEIVHRAAIGKGSFVVMGTCIAACAHGYGIA